MGQKCRKYRRDRKNKIVDAPTKADKGKPCSIRRKKQIIGDADKNEHNSEKE